MSRPSVALSDDQARVLVKLMPDILTRHPIDAEPGRPRSNRTLVRDFVRAVHLATGSTYSPATYRRLLNVYAPGRHPSNDTIDKEKKALEAALLEESGASRQINEDVGHDLANVVRRAVESALEQHGAAKTADHPALQYLIAQLDFLQRGLSTSNAALAEERTLGARLAGELQSSQQVRVMLEAQLAAGNALALALTQRVDALTTELTGMRKFSMMAIDNARGETRAQQERATHLEGLLKAEKASTQVFRRLAYRNGADIPRTLLNEMKA